MCVGQKLKNEPTVFLMDFSLYGNTYLRRPLGAILLVIHKVYVCKPLMVFLRNFHMICILKKALKYKKHVRNGRDFKFYVTPQFHLYYYWMLLKSIHIRSTVLICVTNSKRKLIYFTYSEKMSVVHFQALFLFNTREINKLSISFDCTCIYNNKRLWI